MSCRIIISPVTNKEETSILWNEIRDIVASDEQADVAYSNVVTEEFVEVFGNWVEEPESIDKSKVNSIGEPLLTEEVRSFIGINSTIVKGPINYYDEPGFKKRNPNFNPETSVNTVNKFGESKKEFPELTPTLNEVKPGVEEIFNNNPELASIGTPQQYSQYLDTLNKPNTNPILKDNQQEQVKKFAELQERLNNKEFLEGAKSAYASTPALQELGTQEEYNDYIARVSLGIIKNPSSGEYNYTSKVKDIVYHGGTITKDEKFSASKGGIHFSTSLEGVNRRVKDETYTRFQNLITAILNIKNASTNAFEIHSDSFEKDIRKKEKLFQKDDKLIETDRLQEQYQKEGKDRQEARKLAIEQVNKKIADNYYEDGQSPYDALIGLEKYKYSEDYILRPTKIGEYIIDSAGDINIAVKSPEQIHILGGKNDIQGFKEFVQGKQFQKLTAEEKAKTIEQVTKEHRSITALKDLAHKIAHRIGGKIEFENKTDVNWKGYNKGMTSVLNEAYMTPDTPFHEILAHPIVRAIKNKNDKKAYYEIESQTDKYVIVKNQKGGSKVFNTLQEANDFIARENTTTLYQSLLKELETGRGKEVFEQVKRDYVGKKDFILEFNNIVEKDGNFVLVNNKGNTLKLKDNKSSVDRIFLSKEEAAQYLQDNKYTLEEQQEEAIVTLLGMLAADKLDAKKDATLISKLKELWKQISDFVKSLLRQDGIKIDELSITTTLNDLAEIMAYGNNKIILPGYKVEYSTPLGNKYDTLEEVNQEIRGLADANVEVDLSGVKIPDLTSQIENLKKQLKDFEYEIEPFNDFVDVYTTEGRLRNNEWTLKADGTEWFSGKENKTLTKDNYKGFVLQKGNELIKISKEKAKEVYYAKENNHNTATQKSRDLYAKLETELHFLENLGIKGFIEKNKEYEQSKEIIEQWKKENNIQYDPEEVYSRGQGFYSSIGAYSNLELDLLLKNLIQHIEDNKKAGGEFTISAFTKPTDKRLKHIEGTGDRVRFVIYPKSEHIKWAAPTDVYSGSVWDAHEKVSKDKKSELLGVSFTKSPALRNINEVSPNLADIIDNLSHVHNELGIELTTNNFRIEYDDNIDYSTKKLIDSINKILDNKYGKLVKPEISTNAKKLNHVSKIEDIPVNEFSYSTYDDIFYYRKESDGKWYGSFTKEEYDKGNRAKTPAQEQAVINNYNLSVGNKTTGKQPTQTKENTTSIDSVLDSYNKNNRYILSNDIGYVAKDDLGNITDVFNDIKKAEIQVELWQETNPDDGWRVEKINKPKEKEYTSQTLTNLKVAALKEVAGKYPRSLIISKVVPINSNMTDNSEIQYSKVSSKQDIEGFKNWVGTQVVMLQTENEDLTPSKASPETIERVKEWLSRIGVDIKALDTARYKGINGVADILNNIIEIAEGKTNEALTEEAMHFAVEIMEITNPALYKKMLNKIGNYQIYKNLLVDETYVKQFTKQGKLDVIGMKKEAIGKVLAETLIRQEQEGVEKPEFLEQSKSWWQQIVEWFKGLINQAGYNPFEKAIEGLNNIGTVESLKNRQELVKLGKRVEAIQSSETSIFQDEINKALDNKDYRAAISLIANQLTPETFQTVVDRNLNGDTKLGQDIQDFARVYLQTAPENPTADTAMATLKKILADYKVVKHSDTVDPDDESNNSYYTAVIAGKENKADRTTEWAKRENLKKTGGKDYMKERAKDPILKMQDTVKALTGTELHAYIEAVIKVFLREDGTIMAEDEVDLSLLPAAKSTELKAVETYLLGDTRKGINGFLFQFEAGTKLFTEQMIFNPNVKNQKGELVGRAGTIDLMAFLPNGKVKVYDWKFMGYTLDKLDQAPQKKSQHALQLADYKRTLKETLGIKDIELQTVPFGVIYKMKTVDGKQIPTVKSVVTGNINIREEENTFLLPVVPEDQSTGNKDVDNLVKALKAHYKKLYDKPVGPEGERYIKIQGLNQLSVAIRNLQVALNFKPLEAQAVTFKQNILETIDKYKEIDVATVDKEDINKQINELLDLLKSADTYSNLDKAFISEYGEENLDKDAASTLKNLSAASSAAKNSKKELTDLLKKYVAHAALQQGFSPTEVLSATKEVQGIINSFLEGTKLPNATMNLFAKIVLDARSNDKRLIATEIKKFGKIYTELQKAYPSDPFKAIGDGHKLIRKTKKEFWDALRDAYENEDANFILANVDEKKLRELVADLIEKRFKQIEETVYTTDEKENREQKESHRNRVIKDFDIFRGKGFEGFQNRSFQALVKEAIIEENHYTEEFKKLSGPALDMYNFIFELNRRAFKQGYLGQGNSMRFFPFVLGTTLERLQQSDNILTGAYSSLIDAFTFQKDDTIEYGQIDPETGKLIKTIPKLFTQIGDKEGRENELSTDLLKVIPLYIRALQEYETSKDLEMSFMAMHTVEKAKGHFEVKDNKVIFEGDAPKVFDSNEVNAAALEVMGNDAIYGMRQDTDTLIDTAVSKTTKGTEEDKLRRSMSVKKSIQQANTYTQGLAVGLKLLVAIPNFVGAFMQSVVNAGLYYTVADYHKNFAKVVGSIFTGKEGNVVKGLIDLIIPLNEDIVKEGQKKIAWKQSPLKWLSVWSFQDVLMSTNRIGDIAHQLTNAYSWLENSMVVDGKIENIRQYVQKKNAKRYENSATLAQVEKDMKAEIKTLKETKSLPKIATFNKDGIIEIPGVTQEEISRYRTKVTEYGRYITGQMSTENKAQYRRNILAQSFMMFKNWIPKQVSLRAMDIKKDPVLGQWEYGRTRLFAKTIMHVGFTKINKINDIINATPEGIAIMQDMLEKKREEYYQKTGLELTITEAEFFDMMRKELQAEMKELAILVFVIGLVVAAKVAQPPEEEDDLVKNRYKFWAKAINKISDEMWFYYNPTSAESITRGSVAPSLGLLSKVSKVFYSFGKETAGYVTENEEWQKEAYPQKYFFNIVPFASQFQNEILSLVFPEEAKERGIRTSAEARAMR